MISRVTKPFMDYILFSNGSISRTMFINMKNVKEEYGRFYYCTTEIFRGKVKYLAVKMSDNEQELIEWGKEHGLL